MINGYRYASVLKELRQVAEIIRFNHTFVPKVMVDRLEDICIQEAIVNVIDKDLLNEICEISNGDFRTCLNVLQVTHIPVSFFL